MVNASQLLWGIKKREIEGKALWGCRAIFEHSNRFLDILWDRQSLIGEEADKRKLQRLLNGTESRTGALRVLKKELGRPRSALFGAMLSNPENEDYSCYFKGVHFYLFMSGGYMYITAKEQEK